MHQGIGARGKAHSYSVSSFVHLTNIHAMHTEGAEVSKEITCPQWNWGLGVGLGIRNWGYSSSVEHVLSMLEGLGSTHSTTKKTKDTFTAVNHKC